MFLIIFDPLPDPIDILHFGEIMLGLMLKLIL